MSGVNLGPGAEFDAIRAIIARLGANARGIGDDAAILDAPNGARIVVSTDTSVDGVHFRREWLSPREIGWRATMAALSDLAAMGATPLGALTAITVPPAWRGDLGEIAAGIGDASQCAQCPVVGGDTSGGTEFSIGVTVLGTARDPVSRSGARPGDVVWVTGTLGGPALALRAWLSGAAPTALARARFAHPEARIAAGVWLAAHGCTAAIDVSDGLIADARHLAAASNVSLDIALDAVPCVPGASAADAAASGEEYELLVCGPSTLDQDFAHAAGVSLTRIGQVTAGPPDVVVTQNGARVEFGGGYDHFSL